MSKTKTGLVVVGVVTLALGAGAFKWKFIDNASEGDRIGVITKCSLKGTIKTHECEAFIGAGNVGTNSGPAMGASVFEFTVRDAEWDAGLKDVIEQVKNAGTVVRLDYIQPRWFAPWRTETGYYVLKVTPRANLSLPTPVPAVVTP